MQVSGEVSINCTPPVVWRSLTDPDVMQACIPGCESFRQLSDVDYQATVGARLAFVKVHFHINLQITASTRDRFYQFLAQGDGGLSGAAEGDCEIALESVSDITEGAVVGSSATLLGYQSSIHLHGVLQKVAEPILKKQASRLVEKFFKRFEAAVESRYCDSAV